MTRREFVRFAAGATCWLAAASLLVACGPRVTGTTQASKLPRLGYLTLTPLTPPPGGLLPFFEGLRGLDYVESKNITVDRRDADNVADRLNELASELVALRPDILVAQADTSGLAAQRGHQHDSNRLHLVK